MKSMELCFFRHGIAVDPSHPDVAADTSGQSRYLTDKGKRKTRAAARGLKRVDGEFDKILTSPWLRAVQTAEILADVLDLDEPEVIPELAGDRDPAELIQALSQHDSERLLLVGHEPLLSSTIATLLKSGAPIDLRKAGACLVEMDSTASDKIATLRWLMTAKQLRWIGKS
jgi:phosphohistidine phosphatase